MYYKNCRGRSYRRQVTILSKFLCSVIKIIGDHPIVMFYSIVGRYFYK
uniref:Uncharacterized protein n=1 Tax=Arundo donax TaxID=35708 RepID=A0A0A9HN37_ARUDO